MDDWSNQGGPRLTMECKQLQMTCWLAVNHGPNRGSFIIQSTSVSYSFISLYSWIAQRYVQLISRGLLKVPWSLAYIQSTAMNLKWAEEVKPFYSYSQHLTIHRCNHLGFCLPILVFSPLFHHVSELTPWLTGWLDRTDVGFSFYH